MWNISIPVTQVIDPDCVFFWVLCMIPDGFRMINYFSKMSLLSSIPITSNHTFSLISTELAGILLFQSWWWTLMIFQRGWTDTTSVHPRLRKLARVLPHFLPEQPVLLFNLPQSFTWSNFRHTSGFCCNVTIVYRYRIVRRSIDNVM